MYTPDLLENDDNIATFIVTLSLTFTFGAVILIIISMFMNENSQQTSQIKTNIVLSKKGHPMSAKQLENRGKQIGFDICFYNRILAVYNMKFLANTCKKILDNPEEKLNLSLEQIQKVRADFKYANTKIAKYINKSKNHPHIDVLEALAA
jgi:hypothetical protein